MIGGRTNRQAASQPLEDVRPCGEDRRALVRRKRAVYLPTADKYRRLTRRPPQGQKGLDERARMASPWPLHPW